MRDDRSVSEQQDERLPQPPMPGAADPQLRQPPAGAPLRTEPPLATALRELGPDYEEALVRSIASRVDELAQQRSTVPAPAPAPPLPLPQPPPHAYGGEGRPGSAGPLLALSIVSLGCGVAATAILAALAGNMGALGAVLTIVVVWIAIATMNSAAWRRR
jgi:Flp pilus assembly protein TadB